MNSSRFTKGGISHLYKCLLIADLLCITCYSTVFVISLLMQMCSECNEKERYDTILSMANKCLPLDRENLKTIAAGCELGWKVELDTELLEGLVGGERSSERTGPR